MSSPTVRKMVQEAKQHIDNLSPEQVKEELYEGHVALIDLRESEELQQNGKIPMSIHAPRGMLEFLEEPTSPYYRPDIEKRRRLILLCANGNRSALAVITLRNLGYKNVAHLDGGLTAWKNAGMPVVE